MKKLVFVFTLLLFACGKDSNDTPITITPAPACTACIGWKAPQDCGDLTCRAGMIIWKSSEKPLPPCDISTCDADIYDCAAFVTYSAWPINDNTQCSL